MVGERGDVVVVPDMDVDDIAVGQVVVVTDDGLEQLAILAQTCGDMCDGTDVGRCGHHAARLRGWIAVVQFHGRSSSRRVIL